MRVGEAVARGGLAMVMGRDNRQDLAALEADERRRLLDQDITRSERRPDLRRADDLARDDEPGRLRGLMDRVRRALGR